MIDDGSVLDDLRQREAVRNHLGFNHYPPLPVALVPVALEAIARANAGQWEDDIPMPDGVQFRGADHVSVADAVETMHLDDFIGEPASADYYCFQCAVWMDEARVDEFNERNDPDGDGPTICPVCGYEVVWWSSPEGLQVRSKSEDNA